MESAVERTAGIVIVTVIVAIAFIAIIISMVVIDVVVLAVSMDVIAGIAITILPVIDAIIVRALLR